MEVAKSRGNPRGWKPIKTPHIPVAGFVYRVVSDGTTVLIQKKAYKNEFPFRTKVRLPLDAWNELEASITGKTDYEAARVLAQLVKAQ